MSPENVEPGEPVSGDDVIYSNFCYDPSCYYFFYIGELKAYGLNHFLRESLAKRHPRREVRFVAIIPDLCAQYYEQSLIVINPEAGEKTDDGAGPLTVARIPIGRFMSAVSASKTVHTLISRVLKHQKELFLSLFESVGEMTLDEIPGVSILGPDKAIARHWNNRLVQFSELTGVVNQVEGEICRGRGALLARTEALREQWCDGIFVSAPYSAAGANSAVTTSQDDVERRFPVETGDYMISRYIPHDLDPTVLAVVAGPDEVYIAGIADQHIVDGNRFVGSAFPSQVSIEQRMELRRQTVAAGRALGRTGYRGIFGCDYLIDRSGKVWFLEINARKQGTTFEFCCTLEQTLPPEAPSLLELEYHAVRHGTFPPEAVEMGDTQALLHWRTYNHKLTSMAVTTGYIPQNTRERESFRRVAAGELFMDYVVLEHLGPLLTIHSGAFLARVVAVANSRERVTLGLNQGMAQIRQTYNEVYPT